MTPIRERLARTPPGYRYSIGRILAIYSGLMVALLLAALDQTIVATALPRVVSELGGITQYAWVFTAYMLGSTVTVPLYGRLGDVYGRKPLFIVAISIFIAGSALCGAAQNMVQLVVFRAIQGVGAGGIFPLTLAMVGMIVPPRDRGRYQGLIGSVFAAASIIGPLIGGFIVDNASWRWIFYVNVPVGGVALTVILITMSSLLLGLVWGGRDYPWASPHVLGALATAVVLLSLFGLWERRVPEPIIPFHLLRNQTVAASVACMAFVGMAMFGTISYVPLFVQGVIGTSATSSGVVLTPLLLGAVTTSFISGQIVSRTGRYRPNTLLGPLILGAGELLLWRLSVNSTNAQAARAMVIAGIGLGLMMQIFVLSVQNSVSRAEMGTATALTQFSRSIGATLGVTLMGVIVNQGLPPSVREHGTVIHRLPPAGREALANALHPAFLLAAGVCGLVFLISLLWVQEVPLRHGFEDVTVGDETSPQPAGVQR